MRASLGARHGVGHALAAVVVLAAGCSKIIGLGDITYVDAATDAPPGMASDCPTAPANTVIACATITHVRADGATFSTRKDLSQFTIAAYISDTTTKSGFRVVSGAGSSDGTARIDNVPDGTSFYFRIHNPQDPTYPWPHYFFTDKHNLELGTAQIGRDDSPTTSETALTINMTGMTPWKAGDSAALASFEGGTQVGLLGGRALVPVGATMFTAGTDWSLGAGESTFADFTDAAARAAQLVDQSGQGGRNDDLWALHFTSATQADNTLHPIAVATIADAVNLSGVTLANGKPATLGGTFQPAPAATNALDLRVQTSLIRNAFRDNGRYSEEDIACFLYATPAASHGLVMANSALASVVATNIFGTSTGTSLLVPFTNPFPATMQSILACNVSHIRTAKVPGTTPARTSFGYSYITSYTPLPASNSFTWMPPLHTVTNLRIGGVDGLSAGTVPFDGQTPVTMSWDPVPGVTHYQVRVKDETLGAFLGVFDTTQSSVLIPADTFTKGNFYVFRVFAIQTSGEYAGGKLLDFEAPLWSARISTGMFRFSDLCGNGVKDPGEECDPGTNTNDAACDPDCSLPVCGDGLYNPAVEDCDDMTDSARCNGDGKCHVPICGDGVVNRLAGEECDDGNLTNGDNCSAQCKLENCGNTKTEAGEACDDGNRVNGDGCDAFCQPEVRPF